MTGKQIAKALDALNDVSTRQLEAAGERLMGRYRKGSAMYEFGQVFADVANNREGGFSQAKWHLEHAVEEVDDHDAATIENGKAPFWKAVREAVEAR